MLTSIIIYSRWIRGKSRKCLYVALREFSASALPNLILFSTIFIQGRHYHGHKTHMHTHPYTYKSRQSAFDVLTCLWVLEGIFKSRHLTGCKNLTLKGKEMDRQRLERKRRKNNHLEICPGKCFHSIMLVTAWSPGHRIEMSRVRSLRGFIMVFYHKLHLKQ